MSEPSFETIRPLLVSVDGTDPVRVALEHHTELFVAEQSLSSGHEDARACATARATTDALGQLTPEAVRFSLDWCALVKTGVHLPRLVVVMVAVDVAGAEMRYAGATVLGEDTGLAAAKAVLDAMNRRLGVTGL